MDHTSFQATLPLRHYIDAHYDPELCSGACRRCACFNRIWACPPFDYDPLERIGRFSYVTLFARKVRIPPGTPLKDLRTLMRPHKEDILRRMLALERANAGLACVLAGECDLCRPLPCTRAEGHVCRHPDITRPSLEAYGFNLQSTISDLFGLDFAWGAEGLAPPFLILVTALFHDSEKLIAPDHR